MNKKIAIRYNKRNICRLPFVKDTKVNREDIISGINYIDAEYWDEVKKHKTVQYKLDNGIIEEVNTSTGKKIVEKIVTKKVTQKDGTETKRDEKVKKEIPILVTNFGKMKPEEKGKLIEETYKIDSLIELKKAELDPEIRYQIEKRIDEIKNAKTDETIDHPKGHQKR